MLIIGVVCIVFFLLICFYRFTWRLHIDYTASLHKF